MTGAATKIACLLVLLAAALGSPSRADACTCPPKGDLAAEVASSAAVFRGKVIAASRRSAPVVRGDGARRGDIDVWVVRLAVERTWKGVETREASVAVVVGGEACGRDAVEVGEQWLVFAWAHAGGLATNRCASWRISEHDLIEALGPGEIPRNPGQGPTPRDDAPAPLEPPLAVHPRHACACSVLTPAAPVGFEGWESFAILALAAGSRRLGRSRSRGTGPGASGANG